jgi:hypothetical protein
VDLRVAIKLIRGAGSSALFRERFLRERQILASLNHPGITRLLDAGHTKSGQPYLVMEYVDGTPVDVYCRGLAIEAKLKLLLLVCDAIRTLERLREMEEGRNARRGDARVLAHSSYALRSLHRMPEAKQRIDRAFDLLRPLGDAATLATMGGEWDNAMRARADYESATGHREQARATSLDLQAKLLALQPSPETDLRHANDMSSLYDALAQVDAKLAKYEEAKAFEARRADLWRLWDGKLPGNLYVRRQMEKPVLSLPPNSAK